MVMFEPVNGICHRICSVGDIATSATKKLLTWMLIQLPHFSAGSFASFWAKEVDAIFEKDNGFLVAKGMVLSVHTYIRYIRMYVRPYMHTWIRYIHR